MRFQEGKSTLCHKSFAGASRLASVLEGENLHSWGTLVHCIVHTNCVLVLTCYLLHWYKQNSRAHVKSEFAVKLVHYTKCQMREGNDKWGRVGFDPTTFLENFHIIKMFFIIIYLSTKTTPPCWTDNNIVYVMILKICQKCSYVLARPFLICIEILQTLITFNGMVECTI